MNLDDLLRPGVHHLIVRHDAFCPLAYGEGTRCAAGCNPITEMVSEATMVEAMTRDFRNRAQRRAAAKKNKKGGKP